MAASIVAGAGVLLLAVAVIRLTVFHTPGAGADIGAGMAGALGVLLLLIGAGLGLGTYVTHRRGKNQAR
ncbi:hypothetical protein MOQ72_21455 [Saccharopolyspora sp. K220]|uniref:hypothetical protein n=1 Tax=Saccharopolyspora soli TaxID=2926618 RepID=UPI001F587D26|nr:hypothetical protein [Saccharopolyspora soli]MCI2420018.1 hypothetical protein [Saccharopolyspora soli]